MTGEWAYVVGLGVIAFDAGGVRGVSLAAISRMVPAALVTPFISPISDRHSRRGVLVVTGVGRAAAVILGGLILILDLPVIGVYICVALASPLSVLMRPAYSALLPSLVRTPHELAACNVATTVIESASMVTGPGLAGILLAFDEPGTVFIVSGFAFLWSALLAWRLPASEQVARNSHRRLITESVEGVVAIKGLPHAVLLILLYLAQTLIRGALNVLIIVVALQLLRMGQPGVGLLNGAIGVGGVVGAIAPMILMSGRGFGFAFLTGLALWGLPLALIGIWPTPVLAVALVAMLGSARSVVEVSGITALQRIVPAGVLGRVLSLLEGAITLALALGAVLAPVLVAIVGTRAALIATGLSLPVLALFSIPAMQAFDRSQAATRDRLHLLRGVSIFEPLPIVALDHLAGRLQQIVASTGQVICRQGGKGDTFFVIAEGDVEVSVDGKSTRIQGRGEFFGEIALLRDVPRTATVTAINKVVLYALHRDDFIGTVTGHAEASAAADAVVTSRLSGLSPAVATI